MGHAAPGEPTVRRNLLGKRATPDEFPEPKRLSPLSSRRRKRLGLLVRVAGLDRYGVTRWYLKLEGISPEMAEINRSD